MDYGAFRGGCTRAHFRSANAVSRGWFIAEAPAWLRSLKSFLTPRVRKRVDPVRWLRWRIGRVPRHGDVRASQIRVFPESPWNGLNAPRSFCEGLLTESLNTFKILATEIKLGSTRMQQIAGTRVARTKPIDFRVKFLRQQKFFAWRYFYIRRRTWRFCNLREIRFFRKGKCAGIIFGTSDSP